MSGQRRLTVGSVRSVRYVGGSTDQAYVATTLPHMSELVPLNFEVNRSVVDCAGYLSKLVLRRVQAKLGVTPSEAVLPSVCSFPTADLLFGYGARPASKQGKPFVYWETFCPVSDRPEHARPLEEIRRQHQTAVEKADLVMTPLQGSADNFSRAFPEYQGRVVAVPFFLPKLADWLATERRPRDPEGRVKFLFVGSDARRKGLEDLADALRLLPAECVQKSEFCVVSMMRDGSVELPEFVQVETFNPDIKHHFFQADVFVLPTRHDSFGFVLVEAMAAGCAVLTTDDPIRREICGDGALYAGVRNPAALAAHVQQLVNEPAVRAEMAAKNRSLAASVFAPQVVAQAHYDAFASVVA